MIVKPGYKARLFNLNHMGAFMGLTTNAYDNDDVYYFEEHFLRITSSTFLEYFIKEKDFLKILYSDQWDSKTLQWKNLGTVPTIKDGIELIKNRLTFSFSNPITQRTLPEVMRYVQFTFEDVHYSASILNDLIYEYNKYFRSLLLKDTELKMKQYEKILQEEDYLEVRKTILMQLSLDKQEMANIRHRNDVAFSVVQHATSKYSSKTPKLFNCLILSAIIGFLLGILMSTCVKVRLGLQQES